MNFTQEIKHELLAGVPEKRCCRSALLAAALQTSGDWNVGRVGIPDGFSFTSENEDTAEYFLNLVESLFGVRMTLIEAVRDPKHGRDKLTFSYSGPGAGEFVEEIVEHLPSETLEDCCAVSCLKGAFLGSGSCSVPRGAAKGYHLEFIFREERDAAAFSELLDRLQLIGNVVPRGDTYIVYSKSREIISDALSTMEALGALNTFERISADREERNNENRVSNCVAGNADKAAKASVAQTMAFRELEREGVLAALPDELASAAEARLSNPTLSLAELAALLGIGKSCLNHRMRKLMQLYAEQKK